MIRLVEVAAHFTVRFVVSYVVKMGQKPVHKSVFGLSHILHPTFFARDAVYEVGAFTSDVVSGLVVPTRRLAAYVPCFVEFGTVSAGFGVTWVAWCGGRVFCVSSLSSFLLVDLHLSLFREFGLDQKFPQVFGPLVGCDERGLMDLSSSTGFP